MTSNESKNEKIVYRELFPGRLIIWKTKWIIFFWTQPLFSNWGFAFKNKPSEYSIIRIPYLQGGLKAVIVTDVLQGMISLICLLTIVLKGIHDVGGVREVINVNQMRGRFRFFK